MSIDLNHIQSQLEVVKKTRPQVDTAKVLRAVELVFNQSMNLREAGEVMGCSHEAIRLKLAYVGLKVPKRPNKNLRHPILSSRKKLIAALDTFVTIEALSRVCDCSHGHIKYWLNYHGVAYTKNYRGKNHHAFVTGFYLDGKGYPRVLSSLVGYEKINPEWSETQHTAQAHRVVVEKGLLGQETPDPFEIHHIDRNVRNYNPGNLALVTRKQHIWIHKAIDTALEEMSLGSPTPERKKYLEKMLGGELDAWVRQLSAANLKAARFQITVEALARGERAPTFPNRANDVFLDIRDIEIRAGLDDGSCPPVEEPAPKNPLRRTTRLIPIEAPKDAAVLCDETKAAA